MNELATVDEKKIWELWKKEKEPLILAILR